MIYGMHAASYLGYGIMFLRILVLPQPGKVKGKVHPDIKLVR